MFLAGSPAPPADSENEVAKQSNTETPWGDTKQSSMTKAPTKAGETGRQKKGHIW